MAGLVEPVVDRSRLAARTLALRFEIPNLSAKEGRRRGFGAQNGPNITDVHASFNTVLWIVCVVAVVVALAALISSRQTWQDFGKNGLLMDSELKSQPSTSPSPDQERDEEIRQMMEARNARRLRRGEAPLDVEQEIARLTPQTIDPELEAEIRQLVKARNYRRVRAGRSPLDIEAEVQREVEKLRSL